MKDQNEKAEKVQSPAAKPDRTAQFIDLFKRHRAGGVPIIFVETMDSIATVERFAAPGGLNPKTPIIQWDCQRGWTDVAGNKPGKTVMQTLCGTGGSPGGISNEAMKTWDPAEAMANCLKSALQLPGKLNGDANIPGAVLFLHNGHEFISNPTVAQGLLNLRNPFKENARTLVVLGPSFTVPAQLAQHVAILDEPLPDTEDLKAVAQALEAGLSAEEIDHAAHSLTGLVQFAAEQALAINFDVDTAKLDHDGLLDRKYRMIRDTPGLSVWRGGETFADVLGCEQAKKHAGAILRGRRAPGGIVVVDEADKGFAGSGGGDTSGVTRRMMGTLASELQDRNWDGMGVTGIFGSGKTLLGKTMAGEAGIPCILFNLGDLQSQYVGNSEGNLRQALKTIDTVCNGQPFFYVTSNDPTSLPTEITTRLTKGTWFFESPQTDGQRRELFRFYLDKFGLADQLSKIEEFDHTDWVPREIAAAARTAWELNLTITEAAESIVPVCRAEADAINNMRRLAHNRFSNASAPGPYIAPWEASAHQQKASGGRALMSASEV